ncbi:hypothetical protein IWW36_004329 [Coemansia brasiliensis]|uniref:Uncharacterized protein n=1 Tax=Coemansia brasiliensis TaxID=2650707 RepID=A0A9W8LYW1_9FUNG|nr:hypothetical protein IWW36_004329 [Coemansia brasiliensis]
MVWMYFRGLPAEATTECLYFLTNELAEQIEFTKRTRKEACGRFWLRSIEDAKQILHCSNYAVTDNCLVRLYMDCRYLKSCVKVVVRGMLATTSEERRLYEHCRKFGTVCKLEFDAEAANIWFDTEMAAQDLVNTRKVLGKSVQAYIDSTVQEIVIPDSNEIIDGEPMFIDSSDSSTDIPKKALSGPKPAIQPLVRQKRVGRKSTRMPAAKNKATESLGNSAHSHSARKTASKRPRNPKLMIRQGTVVRTDPMHISQSDTEAPRRSRRRIRNMLDLRHWREKAPFIYEFIYRRVPELTADDDGCCLSMAWSTADSPGMVNCYLSQGNVQAASLIKEWSMVRQRSDDVSSVITMTTFDIPERGGMANIKSLLSAFNSEDVAILHKNQMKDGNLQAISNLKLRDEGRVLFGCAMESVVVWTTDSILQRGSLLLLDGIDGVYDVGRDYVVANSSRGEVGVWKSGSRNYIWRYNDTRRFRTAPQLETPLVTALHIASSDDGAFVGNHTGCLAYCDFREPYMRLLTTSDQDGAIKCIEQVSDTEILIGTCDGFLGLLDTRYVRTTTKASAVRTYPTPAGSAINAIRPCPYDSNVFATAVDTNVHIYCKEPQNSPLIFTHEAHQSPVTDFGWHPRHEYPYTIGSAELGTDRGSGEIQIWRPANYLL